MVEAKQRARRPKLEWFLLLAICWLAVAVSVHQLDRQSLWVAEGLQLARVQQGLPAIMSGQIAIDGDHVTDPSSPLYPFLLATVRAAGGNR